MQRGSTCTLYITMRLRQEKKKRKTTKLHLWFNKITRTFYFFPSKFNSRWTKKENAVVRAPAMDPMPLPCHWLPSSQRSHWRRFLLCSQIKRPENISKGFFLLLYTAQTHHEDKKGCSSPRLPLALQPGPLSSPKVRNWICGETTHQGGNCGIIDEKWLTDIFLQPGTARLLLPLDFFLHTCMPELVPACRLPNLREKIFPWLKIHQEPPAVIRRKEIQKSHKVDRAHSGWRLILPQKKHFFRQIILSVQVQNIQCDLGWATSWCSREHLQTELSLSWPLCSGFLGRDLLPTQTALCKKRSCIFLRHLDTSNRFFFLSSMMDQCHMQ